MAVTTLSVGARFPIGRDDPRIFGGFLEQIGRDLRGCLRSEKQSCRPDGFRSDVLAALNALGMTVRRYPGGNFVSGYHWQNGVGPRAQRPCVRDLAWQRIEPTTFGTDEFLALCRKLDWAPMLAVNLGTGTPEEARNRVEYCNSPVGTQFSDLRAANGQAEAHGVKL